jgi:membrane-bound serine protease (ClpP class)
MMAGMLGLYLEFSNPGLLFPGLAGGICLILALTAFQVLPINYTGLVLIGLGMALLIAELFIPSFGILGVSGIAAFVLGSLFLFDTPDSDIAVDRGIIFAASLAVGTFMFVAGSLAVHAWRRPVASGLEGLQGEIGEVRTRLAPHGKVWIHGEYWTAEGEEDIEVGQKVQIVQVDHMILRVRRTTG